MLDLIRLSPRRLFPPGGIDLFRQIAVLTELDEGAEVLGVACGRGIALEYFVREFGVTASGVEHDPHMVEAGERLVREGGLTGRLQFQSGRSDALPYRDQIFDVVVGEIGLANHCEPKDAVRELERVTKPGGFVVLVQLVWKAPVDPVRQRVLSEHLGARPLMVVEWKRLLADAGVEDLHTEDWSDEETAFRGGVAKPFPDFAELFSVNEKAGVLRRAWQRWGWRGVKAVLAREREVHKLLTTERVLGLDLLRGRKAAAAMADVGDASVPAAISALPRPSGSRYGGPSADTTGLPLFSGEEGES
jgi:SAM-dependent methyltransferase